MDWLMHNALADMYGPHFLLLYGSVIVMTLAACWWTLRQCDPTRSLFPPVVPSAPDPYEIAYLRDGENAVTRVVIIGLIQLGYLRMPDKTCWQLLGAQRIEQTPRHPDPCHLSHLERCIFDWFSTPHTPREIFQAQTLQSQIKWHCTPYAQRLRRERLLMPPETQAAAWKIGGMSTLVIVGLGGYKLLVALAKGHHNVGFLILIGIVSLMILHKICWRPHLSSRGRAYLERLQLAFERLKARVPMGRSLEADPTLSLLVGLFGVGVLAGTPYDSYQKMLSPKTFWGGGCGGGCGGGGCGGCGGCGGGGD